MVKNRTLGLLLAAFAVLGVFAPTTYAQSGMGGGIFTSSARRIAAYTTAARPATCNYLNGDVYFDTTVQTIGVCLSTNSWALIPVTGGSGGWPLLAPNGTAAAPSYSFSGHTGDGLFGPTGQLNVSVGGVVALSIENSSNGMRMLPSSPLGWVPTANANGGALDTILTRRAAANIQLGAADAAAPIAQALSVQSVVAGTTNVAGTDFTINGSRGTGTGAGGQIVFKAAGAGTTGTAQNALNTVLTLKDSGTAGVSAPQLLAPDGTAAAPSYAFSGATNWGMFRDASWVYLSQGGAAALAVSTAGADVIGPLNIGIGAINATPALLYADAANTLALRNGVNPQKFVVYNTFTDLANYERVGVNWATNIATIGTENAGTGSARSLKINAANILYFQTGGVDRYNVLAGVLTGSSATQGLLTAGTMTQTNTAEFRTVTHRYDWTNAMITGLGAVLSGNIAVATLPAKTNVDDVKVVIDTPDTSANALTVSCGVTGASYIDYVVASDAKAAANTVYGDATAERGTNMTIAGGHLPSYTGTTVVNCQFVKTTTNLNTVTGSTGHVLITTRLLP